VIVGAQAWKSEQELRFLKAGSTRGTRPGRGTIIQLEYVPYSMLVSLIRGARAVLFP